jgi:hypothetical protein
MKLYLHLLKKDLVQFRLLILLWIVCLAFEVPRGINPELRYRTGFQWYFPFLKWGVFILITVLAIQAEKLVGDRAYWLTRPLSRKVLFWSKTAFLVLVLVIPLSIVEVVPLFLDGFGFIAVLPLLIQTNFINLLWVLSIVCFASWTKDLKGFALLMVLSIIIGWILVYFLVVLKILILRDLFNSHLSLLASKEIASILFGLVLLGVAWGIQVFTRASWRSISIFLMGSFTAILIYQFWSWDVVFWIRTTARSPTVDVNKIKVSLIEGSSQTTEGRNEPGKVWKVLEGELNIANLFPGYWIFPTRIRSEMRCDQQISKFDTAHDWPSSMWIEELDRDHDIRSLHSLLPGTELVGYVPTNSRNLKIPFLELEDKVFEECKSKGVHLKTTMDLVFKKLTITGQIAPKEGAILSSFATRSQVNEWQSQYTSMDTEFHVVRIQEKRVKSLWSGDPQFIFASTSDFRPTKEVFYLLYHKRLNQVWIPDLHRMKKPLQETNYEVVGATLSFGGKPGKDTTWISEAKLVQIELEEEVQCQKEFYAENFVLSRVALKGAE